MGNWVKLPHYLFPVNITPRIFPENEALLADARAKKKAKTQERRRQTELDEEEDLLVEHDRDSEELIRAREAANKFKAEAEKLRAEVEHLKAAAARSPTPEPDPIARPNMTGLKPDHFRVAIGLRPGRKHRKDHYRYLEIRTSARDVLAKVGLDEEENLSHQDKTRVGRVYGLLEEAIPEIRPCVGSWGAEWLLKEAFNNRHDHYKNKKKRAAGGDKNKHAGKQRKTDGKEDVPAEPPTLTQPSNKALASSKSKGKAPAPTAGPTSDDEAPVRLPSKSKASRPRIESEPESEPEPAPEPNTNDAPVARPTAEDEEREEQIRQIQKESVARQKRLDELMKSQEDARAALEAHERKQVRLDEETARIRAQADVLKAQTASIKAMARASATKHQQALGGNPPLPRRSSSTMFVELRRSAPSSAARSPSSPGRRDSPSAAALPAPSPPSVPANPAAPTTSANTSAVVNTPSKNAPASRPSTQHAPASRTSPRKGPASTATADANVGIVGTDSSRPLTESLVRPSAPASSHTPAPSPLRVIDAPRTSVAEPTRASTAVPARTPVASPLHPPADNPSGKNNASAANDKPTSGKHSASAPCRGRGRARRGESTSSPAVSR
ncbi:hypothetical protein FRC07_006707, partial [Ceratobasidium sp. 392]